MMFKTTLAALLLAVAPIAATAQAGCSGAHDTTTSIQCADGQSWDATTQACVDTTA